MRARQTTPANAGAALVCLLLGGLQTLGFAPVNAWYLQILALAGLVGVLRQAPAKQAALYAWLFAAGWLASGFWWITISLHRYGGLPLGLSWLAVLLLGAALALYYALAIYVFARWRSGVAWRDALLFAALWTLAELARATIFTGFPWIAQGYAHVEGPMAAYAPWIGVYGIGALAAWLSASLGLSIGAWKPFLRVGLTTVALVLGLAWVLPQDFTQDAGRLKVSLLQTNVPQDEKFEPTRLLQSLSDSLSLIHQAKGDFVLTPESMLPVLPEQIDPAWWAAARAPFNTPQRALMIGTFLGNPERGYTNSLITLSATEPYRYGKRHLLPFGEMIPPGFGWLMAMINVPIGDQLHGQVTAPFVLGGQRIRPLICYEDLFGEDFAAQMVGPDAPTLLANASNLAWFGTAMIQDQHLQFSQMRALEFQRPVIRSTNTGATAVVDHRGRITARLPADMRGILEAVVQGRSGATPYACWLAFWGLWPLATLCLVLIVALYRRSSP